MGRQKQVELSGPRLLLTNIMAHLIKPALIIPIAFLFGGCVQTQFHKSVTVHKDAAGNITETIETESISQPGSAWPVKFQYLHLNQGGGVEAKEPIKAR